MPRIGRLCSIVVPLLAILTLIACSDEQTLNHRTAQAGRTESTAESSSDAWNNNDTGNTSDNIGNTPGSQTGSTGSADGAIPTSGPDSSTPSPSNTPPSGNQPGNENESSNPQKTYGDKVIEVARAELGRGIKDVGKDLSGVPGKLQPLLNSPDDAWCSEFVSWVYLIAGIPFTGGPKNGQKDWMLASTTRIRSYFQDQKRWIQAGSAEWQTYNPKAGDYIRYNNGTGHSGIIQRTEGTTLITVEGNWNNMVKEGPKKNWRTAYNELQIDGIGILEPK